MKKWIFVVMLLLISVQAFALTINNGNALELGDDRTERFNPQGDRESDRIGSRVTGDFPINGSGFDNITFSFRGVNKYEAYDFEVSFDRISNTTGRFTANVPPMLDSVDADLNRISPTVGQIVAVSDDGKETQIDVRMRAQNGLAFDRDRIYITVDGDEYRCDTRSNNDCDRDIRELRLDANVRLRLEIQNVFRDRSRLDIRDVDLDIESDNRDFDPFNDNDRFSLRADDIEIFDTDFDIDSRIEDRDSARITITVVGVDENGARHGLKYDFEVRFELPSGEVELRQFNVNPTTVCQGDALTVAYEVLNKGRDRQRNTRVQVVSQELGIDRISDFIDLEDATRSRNDNDFLDSWSLTIPSNQRVGTYVLNGFVYFRDDRNRDASERVERTITVRDCSEPTSPSTQPNQQQNQTDSFVITPPQTETPVTSGTPVTARPVQVQQETDWLLIGLGVLAFILVLVIVYLFVVIVRK